MDRISQPTTDSLDWVHCFAGVLPGPAGSPVGTGKGVFALRLWPRSGSWPLLMFLLLFVFVPPFVPVSLPVSISLFFSVSISISLFFSVSLSVSISVSISLSIPLSLPVSITVSVSGCSSGCRVGGWGGWGLPAAMGYLDLYGRSLFLRICR